MDMNGSLVIVSNPELTNQVTARKNAQPKGQGISVGDLYASSLEASGCS